MDEAPDCTREMERERESLSVCEDEHVVMDGDQLALMTLSYLILRLCTISIEQVGGVRDMLRLFLYDPI
jgi:hypothetical protein